MAKKAPLALVTEQFGGKDKLVDKLVGLLETDQTKEDLRKKLLPVSNRKLLRLLRVATAVKESHGSREKLVAATAAALGRTKDKDYVAKLESLSTGRLLDLATTAERRKRRAQAASK
jgi:hypothetical protein